MVVKNMDDKNSSINLNMNKSASTIRSGFQKTNRAPTGIQHQPFLQSFSAKPVLQGSSRIRKLRKKLADKYKKELIIIAQEEAKHIVEKMRSSSSKQILQMSVERLADVDDHGIYYGLPMAGWFGMWDTRNKQTLSNLGMESYIEGIYGAGEDLDMDNDEINDIARGSSDDIVNIMLASFTLAASSTIINYYSNRLSGLATEGYRNGISQGDMGNIFESVVNSDGALFPMFLYDRIGWNEATRFTNEGRGFLWDEVGITHYKWIQGPGPCSYSNICGQMADGSPYPIGEGPMPVDDTHPNCLCEIEEMVGEIIGR